MRTILSPVAAVVLILALGADMFSSNANSANQEQDRVVDKMTLPGEPVMIVAMKNKKKRDIKFKGKFADDDDWFSGFTISVQNISTKTINSMVIEAVFRRPDEPESSKPSPLTYYHQFHFGPDPFFPEYTLRDKTKIIKPGETVDLNLSDSDYEDIKKALKEIKYPMGVERVELMIHTVGFEDGTIWSGGSWFYRDPDDLNKIIREKKPQGRAQNRSADFFTFQSAAFDNC